MIRNFYFSPKAKEKLEVILDYLHNNWPTKVTKDFILKLDKLQKLISKYPEAFPQSKSKPGIYRCVITKHNTLYYRLNNEDIETLPSLIRDKALKN
jgi:plasmid stabilization system protein ParE